MARIVKHDHKKPAELKIAGETKWICMCGLSKKMPVCDGSHRLCHDEEEGKIYKYENGKRTEVID
jgi:CDGSH-type Zn-finger protein